MHYATHHCDNIIATSNIGVDNRFESIYSRKRGKNEYAAANIYIFL